MKRIATNLTYMFVFALLLLPAQAQTNYTDVAVTELEAWSTSSTERGFAYGRNGANDRLYVVSRNGGLSVLVYNANDPALAVASTLKLTNIAGGTFALNDIGVGGDGTLFACNLVTDSSASAFKCYRWTSEAADPDIVFNSTVAGNYRLGDKVKVIGSAGSNNLEIWAPAAGTNHIIRLTSSNSGTTFGVQQDITLTGGTNGSAPDVAPVVSSTGTFTTSSGEFYLNSNGENLKRYTLNLTGTEATTTPADQVADATIPTGSNALNFFRSADGNTQYLASYISSDLKSKVLNVTNGPAAATVVFESSGAGFPSNANSNGEGDVVTRLNADQTLTLFTLVTNNGINATTSSQALPVELVSFDAVANGSDVIVRWTTASELNSASFALEYRQGTGSFQTAGVLEAQGTTSNATNYSHRVSNLDPGTYTFRLKQVDLDGSFAYSGLIEATVSVPEGYHLSAAYPNPFNPQAMMTISTKQAQDVRVEVYNLLGQQVRTLFSGAMQANQQRTLTFEANGLPSGLYLIRATGETFMETQTVTLAK